MLNIWKKRWREQDSAQPAESSQSPPGGPGNSTLDAEGAGTVPPQGSTSSSWKEGTPSHVPSKRKSPGIENSTSRPPVKKKSKRSHARLDEDYLDSVRLAQHENTVVLCSSIEEAIEPIRQFITSKHESEDETLLVVADETRTLKHITSDIKRSQPALRFTLHENSAGKVALDTTNPNEITLVSAETLLSSLQDQATTLEKTQSIVLICQPSSGINLGSTVATLLRDFYRCLAHHKRPRLFTILALPPEICSKGDFNLLKLEWEVQSAAYGFSDSDRQRALRLPAVSEITITYDPPVPNDSGLLARLHSLGLGEKHAQREFTLSRYTSEGVGKWGAEWMWKHALERKRTPDDSQLREQIWDVVDGWKVGAPDPDTTSRGFNLSSKAVRLIQLLKACEIQGDNFVGIMFVRRRIVALALFAMIQSLQLGLNLSFLRPVVLTRSHLTSSVQVAKDIVRGAYNFVIATRSFEDFELPRATLIIHYDLFDSQITRAYTLSLLCENGHLIYMAERKNAAHRRILKRITRPSPHMQEWTAILRYTPESSIPPDTEDAVECYASDSETEDWDNETIKDPLTSTSLSLNNATTALYRYSSQFFRDVWTFTPLFEYDEITENGSTMFRCRVLLPEHTMTNSWTHPQCSKFGARRVASYAACFCLYNAGVLEHRYFPSPGIPLYAGTKASLAPKGQVFTGTRSYVKQIPKFWENCHPDVLLFPTILRIVGSPSLPYHAPILLLCFQPLPALPNFNLFFSGVPVPVQLRNAQPITVEGHQMEGLRSYSIRVWRNIRNKPLTCPADKMPYYLAPVDWNSIVFRENESYSLPQISNAIRWDLVSLAAKSYAVPLKFGDPETIEEDTRDALILDRFVEFTRRYEPVTVRSELSPLSMPPSDIAVGGKHESMSFLDFCKVYRMKFPGLKDEHQPLLEVKPAPNFLDPLNPSAQKKYSTDTHRIFIPELCAKSTLPASMHRTILLLPPILHRINELLLAKELNVRLFGNGLDDSLLHMALATRALDAEYDYERLEMLGDTLLKLMATTFVFLTNLNKKEGDMHEARKSIISNLSLFQCCLSVGLPAWIHHTAFSLKPWPPLPYEVVPDPVKRIVPEVELVESNVPVPTSIEGKKKKKKKQPSGDDRPIQHLGDKAIADVGEAIIAVGYLSGGLEMALKVANALKLKMPGVEQWSDFGRILESGPNIWGGLSADGIAVENVEAIVGHKFARPELLKEALILRSSLYEKLEFIGDAILEFMIVRHVFDSNQQMTPGGLTLLKGAMASNSCLAAVSVKSGLYHHLRFQDCQLSDNIKAYVTELEQKEAEEYIAAARDSRGPGQYWHDIQTPKRLADVVETVLGALYISDGLSMDGAEKFFQKVLKPFYTKHISLQTLSHHPTKVLFELFHGRGCQHFSIMREGSHCSVLVHDVVLSDAIHQVPTMAARHASVSALDALEGDPGFLTRTCTCKSTGKGRNRELKDVLAGFEEDDFE